MHINLRTFETFIKVVEAGSMSGATRSLDRDQAQVSRDISKLEHAFKCKLLKRHRDGSDLTKEGKEVLEKVKTVLKILMGSA